MAEIICNIGRVNKDEYWVEDGLMDVQVGWINRSDENGKWYIFDGSYNRKTGPFDNFESAKSEIEEGLKDEFGTRSIAN